MNYSPRYGRFRALLRQIREEAGFNQTALAQKLGKPQTFVSKSELGERRMDFLETLDFCEACHVSPIEFIDRLQKGKPTETEKPRKKRQSPRHMDREGRLTRQGE
jgi:transcriptional regulator with XRE-family HTH domain